MKNLTLHQLKVFEAAARHSSFTRAAEELYLTQPTVSIQVKQLTKAVGLPLFEQIGKRLYLTEAGRQLYKTTRQVFEQLEQLDMTIADLQGMKQGQLRLAVITTAKYFIPRLIGPFCQRYPGINVSLKVTNHEGLVNRINDNLDDLYVLSRPPSGLDITVQPFLDNPLVVVGPATHPLAKQRGISLERIAQEPFILRERGSGTREAAEQLFAAHNLNLNVKLDLGSNEAIKQAILGGLGLAVLSYHTLTSAGATPELVMFEVEGFPIHRQWHAVYPAGKQLSTVAATFLDYLLTESQRIAADIQIPEASASAIESDNPENPEPLLEV
ncbi:HTH-type transcriptional activator CmpR [Synechococcus elongatus]|uniref:HTH-type transcriptional activator CmpR n=1 Tax=Synechococcus elongatus TaxID=32046 RepID=UPI0030D2E631